MTITVFLPAGTVILLVKSASILSVLSVKLEVVISESLKLELTEFPSTVIRIFSFISISGFTLKVRLISLSRSTPVVCFAGSAFVIFNLGAQ